MALDSSKVVVAVSGAVSVAPTATAAPTDAATALNVAFKDMGYISEDGITETRDRSTDDIKGWQGSATVRTVVTDSTLTYEFTMLETTIRTQSLAYGATATSSAVLVSAAATGGRQSFVIDVIDGANLTRIYIPQGEVTEVGDTTYASGEPVSFPVTITAYPDTTLGASAKKFFTTLAA